MSTYKKLLEFSSADYCNVTFYKKADKWWKKKFKFEFLIKPIVLQELIIKDEVYESIKENMENGKTNEESINLEIEKLRNKLNDLNFNELCILFLTKFVVSPKVVEIENDLKENEIPINKIPLDMKSKLMEQILKISPEFDTSKLKK